MHRQRPYRTLTDSAHRAPTLAHRSIAHHVARHGPSPSTQSGCASNARLRRSCEDVLCLAKLLQYHEGDEVERCCSRLPEWRHTLRHFSSRPQGGCQSRRQVLGGPLPRRIAEGEGRYPLESRPPRTPETTRKGVLASKVYEQLNRRLQGDPPYELQQCAPPPPPPRRPSVRFCRAAALSSKHRSGL